MSASPFPYRPHIIDIIQSIREVIEQHGYIHGNKVSYIANYFVVELHHEVLDEYNDSLLRRCEENTREALDDYVTDLNHQLVKRVKRKLWDRIAARLPAWLAPSQAQAPTITRYEPFSTWAFSFAEHAEENRAAIYVNPYFQERPRSTGRAAAPPPPEDTQGPRARYKTVVINRERRTTTQVPSADGAPTSAHPRADRTTRRTDASRRTTRTTPSADPAAPDPSLNGTLLAVLTYHDQNGESTFEMRKPEVLIGRIDDDYPHVDLHLQAPTDVSREHLTIRYDHTKKQFFVKDTSLEGTMMGREKLPKDEVWVPMPDQATLRLAGTDVLVTFERSLF